mgnify:FL=1
MALTHRLVQQEHGHTELDQRVEILDETYGQVMAVLHAVGERGQRNRGGQAGNATNSATMATNVATKRYASTLMAFILDSARQYSGSTPQPISDTSSTAIPIRVCSTVRTEVTSPHHSD